MKPLTPFDMVCDRCVGEQLALTVTSLVYGKTVPEKIAQVVLVGLGLLGYVLVASCGQQLESNTGGAQHQHTREAASRQARDDDMHDRSEASGGYNSGVCCAVLPRPFYTGLGIASRVSQNHGAAGHEFHKSVCPCSGADDKHECILIIRFYHCCSGFSRHCCGWIQKPNL